MKNFSLPDLPDQIQRDLGLSLVEESLWISKRVIISDGIFSPKVIEPCFALLSFAAILLVKFEEIAFSILLTLLIPLAIVYLFHVLEVDLVHIRKSQMASVLREISPKILTKISQKDADSIKKNITFSNFYCLNREKLIEEINFLQHSPRPKIRYVLWMVRYLALGSFIFLLFPRTSPLLWILSPIGMVTFVMHFYFLIKLATPSSFSMSRKLLQKFLSVLP